MGFEFGSIVWSESSTGTWWPCVMVKPEKNQRLQAGHVLLVEFGTNLTKEQPLTGMQNFSEGRDNLCEPSVARNPIPEDLIPDFLAAVDEAEVAYNGQIQALTTEGDDEDAGPKVDRILSHRPGEDGGEVEYLIKWERKSHLHNEWCPRSEVDAIARIKLPRAVLAGC